MFTMLTNRLEISNVNPSLTDKKVLIQTNERARRKEWKNRKNS